jgi:flavodoxin
MNKFAIVYKTLYGATKKYAEWIGSEIKAKVFEMDSVKLKSLDKYDTIIVMSGTYAARMPLTRFLKENWDYLKKKRIVIVAVGAAPEDNIYSKLCYLLVPGKIRKCAAYFKLHGPYKNSGEQPRKSYIKRVVDYLKKIEKKEFL